MKTVLLFSLVASLAAGLEGSHAKVSGALEKLPEAGFQVIALPMKIRGGSGGPLRIVAVLPGSQ